MIFHPFTWPSGCQKSEEASSVRDGGGGGGGGGGRPAEASGGRGSIDAVHDSVQSFGSGIDTPD